MAFGWFEASLVFAFVAGMAALTWYELRILRRRRAKAMERGDLPEQAHNALVTTRAIRDALGRGGVSSPEADVLLLRAETARERRAYTEAVDLAARAREILTRARQREQQMGDLAKLERVKGTDEETTKERLTKETPKHFLEAKFTMNLARDSVETHRGKGRDVAAAEAFLGRAQTSFDAEDYTQALALALQAKRSAEEALPPDVRIVVETTSAAPAAAPARGETTIRVVAPRCAACNAGLRADDEFCRKCGAKVTRPRTCADCGAPLKADDTFCRKCGAKA